MIGWIFAERFLIIFGVLALVGCLVLCGSCNQMVKTACQQCQPCKCVECECCEGCCK